MSDVRNFRILSNGLFAADCETCNTTLAGCDLLGTHPCGRLWLDHERRMRERRERREARWVILFSAVGLLVGAALWLWWSP